MLLGACQEDEVRGVMVAKFQDGSAYFIKRIAISTIDGPALSLALVSKSKRCELLAPVPAGALSGIGDCKDVSGIASLRCEGELDLPLRWQMTSCHSGFGRSFPRQGPVFVLGFSGNTYTAQNQLDLAMETQFDAPCNPSLDCGASALSLSQLLDLSIGRK